MKPSALWSLTGLPRANPQRGSADHRSFEANTLLARERQPILIDPQERPLAALLMAKERWIKARSGRAVEVIKCDSSSHYEQWQVIFVEDDKGIVRAAGASWTEALGRAIALLGLVAEDDNR